MLSFTLKLKISSKTFAVKLDEMFENPKFFWQLAPISDSRSDKKKKNVFEDSETFQSWYRITRHDRFVWAAFHHKYINIWSRMKIFGTTISLPIIVWRELCGFYCSINLSNWIRTCFTGEWMTVDTYLKSCHSNVGIILFFFIRKRHFDPNALPVQRIG